MENASKAIIIAGGLLISILTISIFYFVFGQTGNMVGEISVDTNKEQLIAFNKGFEAYNKKIMYGTDIISVLNKAIDNNKQYNVEYGINSEDQTFIDYYVDIEFEVYDRDESNKKLTTTKIYSLSEYYTKEDNDIWNNYLKTAGDNTDEARSFKFAGFECIGTTYVQKVTSKSSATAIGRINKMTFKEIY